VKQSVDDRKAQLIAHKAAVEAVRSELAKVKDGELEALRHQCEADLGMLCLFIFVTKF